MGGVINIMKLNKIYTCTGDTGVTTLTGGQKVSKSHLRVEGYGTIDELVSFVGNLIITIKSEIGNTDDAINLEKSLYRIQNELFIIGSILASPKYSKDSDVTGIKASSIKLLEDEIDEYNTSLPELKSFVLPGGSRSNTEMNICRCICRRAERIVVKIMEHEELPNIVQQYLNRLSDSFFVWGRWINYKFDFEEILWKYDDKGG
jgi:cob(I)alamin adenosyltransferase